MNEWLPLVITGVLVLLAVTGMFEAPGGDQ